MNMEVNQYRWFRLISSLTIIFLIGALHVIHAQDKPWLNPTRPNNCEDALALLDMAALEARNDKESYIIVVARLGDGEKLQRLNRERLETAVDYLKGKAGNKMVATSGERIKGYGRLEFYVGGKLLYVLAYPRKGFIDCRGL